MKPAKTGRTENGKKRTNKSRVLKKQPHPFISILAEERKRTLAQIKLLSKSGIEALSEGNSVFSGNHPAECNEEIPTSLTTIPQLNEHLECIEAALGRIADGTFGICVGDCGEMIPEKRLLHMPTALMCVSCQEEADEKEQINMSGTKVNLKKRKFEKRY